MAVLDDFPHKSDMLFRFNPTDPEKLSKKRIASTKVLDNLANKVCAAQKKISKLPRMQDGTPVDEDASLVRQKELLACQEAYDDELFKRQDLLRKMESTTRVVDAEPKNTNDPKNTLPPIPKPRKLGPNSLLREWEGPNKQPGDMMLHDLFVAAQREAEGKGHSPAGVREYAVNKVISRMNQSFVHITQRTHASGTSIERLTASRALHHQK
ncbi:TPA_asm: oncoid [Monosiga MELD virus 1]|nr:TPA_asm: oncoid [Monosiga MELD virus 1]